MIVLLIAWFTVHLNFSEHLLLAERHRHLILLGIGPELESLPTELAEAACPPLRLQQRFLPVDDYLEAELDRNLRLYGKKTVLLEPEYVVLHFTVIDDAEAVIRAFSRPSSVAVGNQPSVTSLISVHYMVDQEGQVTALLPENRTATGSYGLDHKALAIEMVAKDEEDLMSRPEQLLSAFCLVDGLVKKYRIPVQNVISHQELASGKFFLSDYTDLADSEYPYFYPEPHFRYDPGPTVTAWCREFLLRRRGLWELHPRWSGKS